MMMKMRTEDNEAKDTFHQRTGKFHQITDHSSDTALTTEIDVLYRDQRETIREMKSEGNGGVTKSEMDDTLLATTALQLGTETGR